MYGAMSVSIWVCWAGEGWTLPSPRMPASLISCGFSSVAMMKIELRVLADHLRVGVVARRVEHHGVVELGEPALGAAVGRVRTRRVEDVHFELGLVARQQPAVTGPADLAAGEPAHAAGVQVGDAHAEVEACRLRLREEVRRVVDDLLPEVIVEPDSSMSQMMSAFACFVIENSSHSIASPLPEIATPLPLLKSFSTNDVLRVTSSAMTLRATPPTNRVWTSVVRRMACTETMKSVSDVPVHPAAGNVTSVAGRPSAASATISRILVASIGLVVVISSVAPSTVSKPSSEVVTVPETRTVTSLTSGALWRLVTSAGISEAAAFALAERLARKPATCCVAADHVERVHPIVHRRIHDRGSSLDRGGVERDPPVGHRVRGLRRVDVLDRLEAERIGLRGRVADRRALERVVGTVAVGVRVQRIGLAVHAREIDTGAEPAADRQRAGVARRALGRRGALQRARSDRAVAVAIIVIRDAVVVGVRILEVGRSVVVVVARVAAGRAGLDVVDDTIAVGIGVGVVGGAIAVGVARRHLVAAFDAVGDAVLVGVCLRIARDGCITASVASVRCGRSPGGPPQPATYARVAMEKIVSDRQLRVRMIDGLRSWSMGKYRYDSHGKISRDRSPFLDEKRANEIATCARHLPRHTTRCPVFAHSTF